MDTITIKGLEVFAKHGVLKEENVLGQKFIIDAVMYCSTREAANTDDITKSINYAYVCRLIERVMCDNTFNLIETVAENIAEAILLEYRELQAVTVAVKKPWAPILMNVDTVEVKITRKRHRAYIALGSNMGDKRAHLEGAVKEIDEDRKCTVKKVSEFIVTEPVGGVMQDDFLNGCILIETLYTPHELLDFLHVVEKNHNRERKIHWGPRTLDLDIIMYDDIVMADDTLIIPHKEMTKREFVLKPLCEIAPYAVHPTKKMTVSELLEAIRQ